MYWTLSGWQQIAEPEATELIENVEKHIAATYTQKTQVFKYIPNGRLPDGARTSENAFGHGNELFVKQVLCRPLPFYPIGTFIYRLLCARPNRSDLEGYEDIVSVFVVFDSQVMVLLDWTSPPIHSLNTKLVLNLTSAGVEVLADYLIFFCSFLGGDSESGEGIAPFLLPQRHEDLRWDEKLEPLEETAPERLELLPKEPAETTSDPFDLGDDEVREHDRLEPSPRLEVAERDERSHGTERRLGEEQLREAVTAAFREFDSNPMPDPSTAGTGEQAGGDREPRARFRALVWYGGILHISGFSIAEGGAVEMSDDEPVGGEARLPVPLWEVQRLPSRISILCRQRPRESLGRDDLVRRMQSGGRTAQGADRVSNDDSTAELTLRGLRVTEDLRCSGKFKHRIVFDDVEFAGYVDLSDCTFDRSLIIRRCRFLYSLSMKDAEVHGSLRLDQSTIEGAYRSDHEQQGTGLRPALSMDGLRVGRLLSANWLVVNGRIRARSLRVGGLLSALGLSVRQRAPERNKPALDLGNATVEGPVNLSCHSVDLRVRREHVRTRISGPATFEGLQARSVALQGARFGGDLDLSGSRIRGTLDFTPFQFITTAGLRYWRTQAHGELNLRHSNSLEVQISGASIGSNLSLVGARLEGSFYARLWGQYQTRISGQVDASGATIEGVLELEGAKIGGDLVFVTGRCGRLRASVGLWKSDQRPPKAGFEPVRASGIILSEVEFFAGASFTGVDLHGTMPRYSRGGIVMNSVRIGGALTFWRAEEEHYLRQRALGDLRETDRPELKPSLDDAIAGVRARIAGDLDLQGVRLQGAALLGRLDVAGQIRLDHAEIGGNLRTDYGGLSCMALSANGTVVRGETCLGRLNVSGPVCLDNAEVGGNLRTDDGGLSCMALSANGTVVRGETCLGRLKVSGPVCLDHAEIGGNLRTDDGGLSCTVLSADGTVVRGETCLGGLNVSGRLCLDNAEIGGNLRTDGGLSCAALSANRTTVRGNADFRETMVATEGFRARGMKVDGSLLLASPPEEKAAPASPCLKVTRAVSSAPPSIDLDGARASRLVISGTSICPRADDTAISLLRAQFGQLSIVGFDTVSGKCTFPVGLRLWPIDVGDWQIEPRKEAAALLKAAEFDRGLYIEIERRLARLGISGHANDTYRRMIWQSLAETKADADQKYLSRWRWRLEKWKAVVNGVFSRHGTVPYLMAFWLLVSAIPAMIMFSVVENIEFPAQGPSRDGSGKAWNPVKGIGLAVSYAVPVFGGARAEQARARPFGPTCLPDLSELWMAAAPSDSPHTAEGPKDSETPQGHCRAGAIHIASPYDIALLLSFLQFWLWVLIAANLPAIIRRRN